MKFLLIKKLISVLVGGVLALAGSLSLIPEAQAAKKGAQKTFVITAYYSPLPGQEHYVTGTYEGDKRLNGNGVVGANLTPVYEGMLAAPSHIPFGTKISCPPFFSGTVHDRGGAIVKAGLRGHAYDRLDFWAGKGEEAMKSALIWGKRTLACTVYDSDHSLDQYVNLPKGELSSIALQYYKKAGGGASKYEALLAELGYSPSQLSARIAFQIRHGIIASKNDPLGGTIGPHTRSALDGIAQKIATQLPKEKLAFGMVGEQVRKLQHLLSELGYLKAPSTGRFGEQTREALVQFQLDQKLIDSPKHQAAGYGGHGTIAALKKHLQKEYAISKADEHVIATVDYGAVKAELIAKAEAYANENPELRNIAAKDPYEAALKILSKKWRSDREEVQESSPEIRLASADLQEQKQLELVKRKLLPVVIPFTVTLGPGMRDPSVRKLQAFLKERGYFQSEVITDVFGTQTREALARFQKDQQIIKNFSSPESGILGPKTMTIINTLHREKVISPAKSYGNVIRGPAIHPDDLLPASARMTL